MRLRTFRNSAYYLARAGNKVREQAKVCIEGEYVNLRDIAERINVSETLARRRLKREQNKPGAVTWQGLTSAT